MYITHARQFEDGTLSYVSPPEMVDSMVESGSSKGSLSVAQLLLRSGFSVFLLAGATVLAVAAGEQTGFPIVGALLFPMGLIMVVLFNMELLTGNFATLPVAAIDGATTHHQTLRNFWWVLLGHLVAGLLAAALFAALLTSWWTTGGDYIAEGIIDTTVTKTLEYQELGYLGGATLALLSGILCNWLVALGVVLGMSSNSTAGKIMAIWPPIAAFFALDLEHSVVNLFLIPTGMMLGAPVGIDDWWLWNQIPVLLGNLIGGLLLVGLPLYYSHRRENDAST